MKHRFLLAILFSGLCLTSCSQFRETPENQTLSSGPVVVDSFCFKTELHDGSGKSLDTSPTIPPNIPSVEDSSGMPEPPPDFFYVRMLAWSDGSISVANIPKPITIWDKPDTTDPKETIVLKDRLIVSCLESNG
jgi:hypothetical protein